MMRSFAADLVRTRAAIIRDEADAVVAVLMDTLAIDEDPRARIGYQDAWYHNPVAVDMAIRVMVVGFGMTQTDAAWRMGFSPGKAYRAGARGTLTGEELALYDAALGLLGAVR